MVDRTLNKGLGAVSVFAPEGPEAVGTSFAMRPRPTGGYEFPSMTMFSELLEKGVPDDLLVEYLISGSGIMPNEPISPAGAQQALERIRSLGYQPPAPTERDTFSSGTPFPTLPPGERQRRLEAERIAAMSPDLDIFAEEGPGLGPSLASVLEENVPAKAASPRPLARPQSLEVATESAPEPMPEADPVESAFGDAMEEFIQASGQEAPEVRDMDFYRKQFAEATGLDISGKPDKSAALMAFGLALMQNRAGKGFNVGNILRSVGEAGQAAMPALQEAKQEAKAARMAAGKYALEKIQAGESARAALAAEQRAFAREAFLKQMEFDAAAAKTAGQREIKNVASVPVVTDLNVRRGMYDGLGVFVDATDTANTLVRGYNANFNALQTLTELENSITEIANSESPALTMIADRINSVLAGAGLKDPRVSFGDEGLSQEEKANALRDSFIQEFKRLLTQETGNGISNVDIERALASLGQLNIFQNPQQAIFRVRETRGLFDGKLGEISTYIGKAINDPSQFVNEREYNRAVEIFNERLGKGSPYNVTVDEGVPTVDVTGG